MANTLCSGVVKVAVESTRVSDASFVGLHLVLAPFVVGIPFAICAIVFGYFLLSADGRSKLLSYALGALCTAGTVGVWWWYLKPV